MTATPEFDAALLEFKATLKPEELAEFRITKLEDVTTEIARIEQVHEKDRLQRGLRRIDPFIQGLQRYAGVVEQFVQVKPDAMALIWGPIKLILEATHRALKVFDTILDAFRDVGECLPRFKEFGTNFDDSPRMEHVLVLVYKNILDFYAEVLKVIRKKTWKKFFDIFWTGRRARLEQLLENIRHSRDLVDVEASAAGIAGAHQFFLDARIRFEEESKHRVSQMFQTAETWLNPMSFEHDLERFEKLLDSSNGHSGSWLLSHPDFQSWRSSSASNPILWLSGIPGAGKTVLSYSTWSHLCEKATGKGATLALFISDEHDSVGQRTLSATTVLRTIAFQLIGADGGTLLPVITAHISEATRKVQSRARKSVENLLDGLFDATDLTEVVLILDGLDEMPAGERAPFLQYLLSLPDKSTQTALSFKLLISCRGLPDIKASLSSCPNIEVHDHNAKDIREFAEMAKLDLQLKYRISEQKSMDLLQRVSSRSEGMFLYCHLMIHTLRHQPNLKMLQHAVENLPKGLQAAYSRIIRDILNLEEQERDVAISILQLLVSAKGQPPRIVEIQRIV